MCAVSSEFSGIYITLQGQGQISHFSGQMNSSRISTSSSGDSISIGVVSRQAERRRGTTRAMTGVTCDAPSSTFLTGDADATAACKLRCRCRDRNRTSGLLSAGPLNHYEFLAFVIIVIICDNRYLPLTSSWFAVNMPKTLLCEAFI